MTANLQRVTVRQTAQIMNVSERTVYMARELIRSGRTDLVLAVEAGRISVRAALVIAKPQKYGRKSERLADLAKAWKRASQKDRERFLPTVQRDPA